MELPNNDPVYNFAHMITNFGYSVNDAATAVKGFANPPAWNRASSPCVENTTKEENMNIFKFLFKKGHLQGTFCVPTIDEFKNNEEFISDFKSIIEIIGGGYIYPVLIKTDFDILSNKDYFIVTVDSGRYLKWYQWKKKRLFIKNYKLVIIDAYDKCVGLHGGI